MKLIVFITLVVHASLTYGQTILEASEYSSDRFMQDRKLVFPDSERRLERNTIYVELAGSGGFGSFNYEWNFKTKEQFRWMLRTGISGTYIDKNNGAALIFPVMVHGVYGKKHGLDVGFGQSLSITTRGSFFVRAPLSFGYRFEPEGKRMFYRFSYTPIVSYLVDVQWENWAGVSVGFKLNPRLKR
jgi:hypothetical protein